MADPNRNPSDDAMLLWFEERAAPWLRDWIEAQQRRGIERVELAEALRGVYERGHEQGTEDAALKPACRDLSDLMFAAQCVVGAALPWTDLLAELAKRVEETKGEG